MLKALLGKSQCAGPLFRCIASLLHNTQVNRRPGVIAISQEEWSAPCTLLIRIVHHKLHKRQMLIPIILRRVYIRSQNVLNEAIHSLSLTICLQMECSGEPLINVEPLAQLSEDL